MMNKRLIFVSAILFCGYAANGWAGVRVPDMATPRVLTAEVSDVQEDTIYAPIIGYSIGGNFFSNPFRKDRLADDGRISKSHMLINQLELAYAPETRRLIPRYVAVNYYNAYTGLDLYLKKRTSECRKIEKTGVHGRVIISFVVEKNGQITHPTVLQSVHPVLDAQAIKLVEGMPRWQPGTKDEQPVRSQFVLAVNFLDFSKWEEMADYVRMHPLEKVEVDKEVVPEDKTNRVYTVTPTEGQKQDNQWIPRILSIEDVITSYPSFSSGNQTVEQYVSDVVKYPEAAGREKGVVNINMVVNEDGSLSDVQVGSTSNPVFNDEAVRIVKSMPAWTPAKFKGKPVRMRVSLPIKIQPKEEKPYFANLQEYIFDNFRYPSSTTKEIKGATTTYQLETVYVKATIGEDGAVMNVETVKGNDLPDDIFEQEALRVVKSMPRWTPGKLNGKPCVMETIVPVRYVATIGSFQVRGGSVIGSFDVKGNDAIGSFDVKGNDEIGGEMLRAKEVIAQPESPTTKDQKVFDVVEQMPSYPGGPNALFAYLSTIIHYPEDAEENGAQGRVIVTFVVEKDGSISEVKVAKSVFPSLDKEAVRVVSSMPRWNPGKQNGKAVRVKYTVPVTFRLELPQKAVSPTQTGTQTPVK